MDGQSNAGEQQKRNRNPVPIQWLVVRMLELMIIVSIKQDSSIALYKQARLFIAQVISCGGGWS